MNPMIIAGSFEQARDYARANGLELARWRHISRPEQLYGLRGVEVLLVGEYWNSPIYTRGFALEQHCAAHEITLTKAP